MKIRKYLPKDESEVRQIYLDTYFLGKLISLLTKNLDFFDSVIDYYINNEPESVFVLEDNSKVVGYVSGCLDDKKYPDNTKGLIKKLLCNLFKSFFMNKKERKFWNAEFSFVLKVISGKSGELKLKKPKNAGHLHINLLPKYRGKGWGSKLLKAFLKYAKTNNLKIIHAGSYRTRLNPNSNFWLKNGFKVYDKNNSA